MGLLYGKGPCQFPNTLERSLCRHEDLLKLVPESYVSALEAKGEDLALAEVKAEIKKHAQELEALQEALPAGIAVGIAYVNTAKVRGICGGVDACKGRPGIHCVVWGCGQASKRHLARVGARRVTMS